MQQHEESAAGGQSSAGDSNAVPPIMAPTFTGGVARAEGANHMPNPEPYRDPQSLGPLAAKRRSQSLIKNDRSGELHSIANILNFSLLCFSRRAIFICTAFARIFRTRRMTVDDLCIYCLLQSGEQLPWQ